MNGTLADALKVELFAYRCRKSACRRCCLPSLRNACSAFASIAILAPKCGLLRSPSFGIGIVPALLSSQIPMGLASWLVVLGWI